MSDKAKSDLGVSLGIYGFLFVLFLAPIIVIYDVLTHQRNVIGITTNDMTFIYWFAHVAYILCTLIAIILFVIFLKSFFDSKEDTPAKLTNKQWYAHTLFTILSLIYTLPFFLFLFYVPGYWKAIFVLILDAF